MSTDTTAVPTTTPQVAINDIGSAEDFLAAIDQTIKYFNDGDIVEGTIVKVDRDEVLLDIGYKTEGVIPSRELSIKHDVDPSEVVAVGEHVEALVLQKEDKEGRLILSKKRAQYERAWGTIEKIKEEDGVVAGTVIEVVKGGLILDIGLRGFLPASLVEMRRVRDLQPYVGRKIEAKIIELDKNRNNVVLSRRAVAGADPVRGAQRVPQPAGARARSARASSPRSSTSVRSSTSAASTAWCTSPSCPGSTSTTRARSSRSARRSPSRSSTSTWTASGSRCRSRRRRKTRGGTSPGPTRSARSCRARSPSWCRSARSSASRTASRAWCTSPSWPSATWRSPSRSCRSATTAMVKVIDIDLERRRISLSLKQANEGMTVETEFDPTRYGMAAEYDDQGNYIYPEGFDVETGEWLEGFETQREAWEKQYAEAHAALRAAPRADRKAAEADAEAAADGGAATNYSSQGGAAPAESPVARWPATSSSPRCGRSCPAAPDPLVRPATAPATQYCHRGPPPDGGRSAHAGRPGPFGVRDRRSGVRAVTVGLRSVTESARRQNRSCRPTYLRWRAGVGVVPGGQGGTAPGAGRSTRVGQATP